MAKIIQDSEDIVRELQDNNVDLKLKLSNGLKDNLEYIEKVLPHEDAEGTDFEMNNTAEYYIRTHEIEGDTEQIITTGKNLCKPIQTATKSGVTFTNNGDGSYTLNGTATAGTSFYITGLNYGSGTYTISANNPVASSNDAFYIAVESPSGNKNKPFTEVNATNTFVIASSISAWVVVVPNGITLNNFVIKPQLELNNSATDFEPYTGGIPGPNPDYPQNIDVVTGRQEIDICGKNLFDGVLENGGFDSDGLNGENSARIRSKNYTKVLPNTTYTLKINKNTSGKNLQVSISYYNINDYTTARLSYLNWSTNNPLTITTPNDCYYVRFLIAYTDNADISVSSNIGNIQIELGNTATSYEPYATQSYEVNLGKNLFNWNNPSTITLIKSSARTTSVYPTSSIVLPAGTYTLSLPDLTLSNSNYGLNVEVVGVTGGATLTNKTRTFTITETKTLTYLYVFLNSSDNDNATATFSKIQLEKGTEATPYSSYFTPIELCKIGDYQDSIKKNTGKNLIYNVVHPSDAMLDFYFDKPSSKTLTFQFYSNVSLNNNSLYYRRGNSNIRIVATLTGNANSIIGGTFTFTDSEYDSLSSTGNILRVYKSGALFSIPNIYQLEVGSKTTECEPYGRDEWYIKKVIGKVKLTNTNYIERGTTGTNAYYLGTDIQTPNDNNTALVMSNMFQPISFADRNNGLDVVYSQNTNAKLRTANNTSIDWSDATKCKDWLDANKPIIYYVLPSEIYTIITNTNYKELLYQLKQLDKATSVDSPVTYLTVSGDLAAPLKLTYFQDIKKLIS